MIRSLTLLLAVLAHVLVSSAALSPIGSAGAEDAADALADEMAQASNAFGRSLYARLATQEGNLFLSSYSVHAAMQLVREGARGATATEMDKALGLEGLDRGRGYGDLVRALAAPNVPEGFGKDRRLVPAYALNIANAVWAQSGYPMEKPFIDSLAKVYGAPLARVDFKNQSVARKAINDWVARETRERIRDIVPEGMPPPLTRLVLANAIYFKASWAEPFTARWTKEEDFTGSDGVKSKAALMHRVGRYRYAEIDGVQVLELPYRGGHLAMVVYLPASHDGVGALEKKLTQGGLDAEASRKTRLVDVKLPKFRVTLLLRSHPCAFEARHVARLRPTPG